MALNIIAWSYNGLKPVVTTLIEPMVLKEKNLNTHYSAKYNPTQNVIEPSFFLLFLPNLHLSNL